jgi:hypothetical protein
MFLIGKVRGTVWILIPQLLPGFLSSLLLQTRPLVRGLTPLLSHLIHWFRAFLNTNTLSVPVIVAIV